jgi:CubicO group peptidase (beta-lactamase class C family)
MFINARDMARFGYLFLRNGRWKDRQIVSPEWIALARTPGKANPNYGFMNWFLNTGGKPAVGVPPSAVMFAGAGQNIIYIDWDNDMVAVVRWIQGDPFLYEFLAKLVAAVR